MSLWINQAKLLLSTIFIEANSINKENGKVFLTAKKGEVTTNGIIKAQQDDVGGEVRLLGSKIRVYDNAEIDVSGKKGGGEVILGGDYKKNSPNIFNSDITLYDDNGWFV